MIVDRLVALNGDNGLRLANDEEKNVFKNMKGVFENDKWLEVPNLKTQDRGRVNVYKSQGSRAYIEGRK